VLGSHPIYGGDEAFILPRGAGDAANSGERLPWNFRVDPKVAFGMKWSKEQTVVFSVDAINVFNFQAVTAKDETYTNADVFPLTNGNLPADLKTNPSRDAFDKNDINPNFGQPTAYQQPRQIRFGIRTTF
jgi:hypothetical protein